ncbi:MAG: serine hydrolase domain-containing protein, partial [Flavobacteriaceae bacterium]
TPIEQSIDSIFSNYQGKPGCAVAIVKDGKTLFKKGYGLANLSYSIPVDTSTVFNTASNAMQFTAACIFLLEQRGKLKLDDPIQNYLPDFPTYGTTPITIRHLLYHTSGLRSFYATLYAKNKYWGNSYDNVDAVKMLTRHKDLNFKPGTRHYFSGSNYILLANIIEKVSGQPLDAFAQQNLFGPLGMTSTFFRTNRDTIIKNQAIGYEAIDNHFIQNHYHDNTVLGDGGLYMNLEDFIKWNHNLSTGTVGGKVLQKKMLTSAILSNGQKIECSGGLFIIDHNFIDSLPVAVHYGNWGGFQTLYYKFLEQDVAFIIMSNNASTNMRGLRSQMIPLFLGDKIASAQETMTDDTPPALAMTLAEKARFCGKYYSTLNGYLREIALEGDQLMYIRPGASATPLMAISPNELVYEAMPAIKFTFDPDTYGSMVSTVNNLSPMPYTKYKEHSYSPSELKQFENQYHNQDIDGVYELIVRGDELQILVEGEEIFRIKAIAKDLFASDHNGYLTFKRDEKGNITGFIQYDDHLYGLAFNLYSS